MLGPDKDGLINRIHSFLKLENRESVLSPAQLANAIGIGEGHEQSYGGNRFDEAKRNQLYQEFGNVGRSELELFGYGDGADPSFFFLFFFSSSSLARAPPFPLPLLSLSIPAPPSHAISLCSRFTCKLPTVG